MLNGKQDALGRPLTERDIEHVTWTNFQSAQNVTGAQYAAAVSSIQRHGQMCASLFESYDLILTPTMACLPPAIGALNTMSEDAESYLNLLYQMIGFTALFNDTGNPAASLPLSISAGGLPVGCQLIADFGAEALLLSISQQISDAGFFTKFLS